jgi:hypothetical protein
VPVGHVTNGVHVQRGLQRRRNNCGRRCAGASACKAPWS